MAVRPVESGIIKQVRKDLYIKIMHQQSQIGTQLNATSILL